MMILFYATLHPTVSDLSLRSSASEAEGGDLVGRLGFMAVAEHTAWRDQNA